MSYTIDQLHDALDQNGELILTLDSDSYPDGVELHKHDTTFMKDPDEVVLELADGQFSFKPDSVESIATHLQTTADLDI